MPDRPDRIASELTLQLPQLDPVLHEKLVRYLDLVDQYAPTLNLTAFRGPQQLVFELIVESLRLLQFGQIGDGWDCVDLGSGVGSPVVPLAIASPTVDFCAVESRQRRCTFLRQVKAQLALENLTIHEQRTEELIPQFAQSIRLVTARAYAQPAVLLAHAAALLEPGGELRGYLGVETAELEQAAEENGFSIDALSGYEVNGQPRHIYRLLRQG